MPPAIGYYSHQISTVRTPLGEESANWSDLQNFRGISSRNYKLEDFLVEESIFYSINVIEK